jgi:hypothetical protein
MLKGEAKTAYQRAYMRRRRAALKAGRTDKGRGKPATNPVTKRSAPELDKGLAQAAGLRAEIARLKAMLQEDVDAAKLRKKVVVLQAEMASMRRVMKEIAKERDHWQKRAGRKYREADRLLTR